VKYTHLARYIAETPWAITADKLAELLAVFAFRAAGHAFSAEEIQARIGEPSAAAASRSGVAAVLPLRGVIAHRIGSMGEASGGISTERFAAMFRQVVADDQVGTIVFDVDSPGGTIPGVQELAAEIFAARGKKRMVAVANSLMASAAYWIASQADEIVSIPSGTIGSIGVFTAHQDLSQALEQEGVKVTLISAGTYKTEGNPFEPLSDEARQFMQDRVDAAYGQFVKDVARGRGVSVSAVKSGYGEGRALPAKDALAAGLVDRIATMDETLGKLVGRRATGGLRAEELEPELVAEVPGGTLDEEADRRRRLQLS
jgi:signal peptide peptidase SppA